MFSLRAPLGAIVLAILVGLGTVAGIGVAQATDELNIKCGIDRVAQRSLLLGYAGVKAFRHLDRRMILPGVGRSHSVRSQFRSHESLKKWVPY